MIPMRAVFKSAIAAIVFSELIFTVFTISVIYDLVFMIINRMLSQNYESAGDVPRPMA